jgi:uncharacterized membrane protein YccC
MSTDFHKLSLKVPPSTREKLQELQQRTDATNMTEVIRRALSLYDQLTEELAKDNTRLVVQHLDQAGAVEEQYRVIIVS